MRSLDLDPLAGRAIASQRNEAALFTVVATLAATSSVAFLSKDSFFYVYSLIPAYTTVFMLVVTRQINSPNTYQSLGIGSAAWKYWPAAIVAAVVPFLLVWSACPWFNQARVSEVDWMQFAYMLPSWFFTAFGEEVGWRGYWLPRLCSLGRLKTTLITGTFWSMWHFPLYFAGFEEADTDLLVTIAMSTLTIYPFVFILNELRLQSKSIWPGVMFHALANVALVLLFADPESASPVIGGMQIVALTAVAAVLLVLGRAGRRGSVTPR